MKPGNGAGLAPSICRASSNGKRPHILPLGGRQPPRHTPVHVPQQTLPARSLGDLLQRSKQVRGAL
jgi:hypothetical protein